MITIDGSQKSGSGTIVRDVVPFSVLTGTPVRLTNIRARRDKPGLRPQHLKSIEAAAWISGGTLIGAEPESRQIEFTPSREIAGGRFEWNIGTAGSATMMALSLIPLALFADKPSEYRITGGLFQDFAPTALHMKHVLLPLLEAVGAQVQCSILRPGYVPRGSGHILVEIQPADPPLTPFVLMEQGRINSIRGISLSSHLDERQVSRRMADACIKVLRNRGYRPEIEAVYDTEDSPAYEHSSIQAGAALVVWAETGSGCIIGSDMAGARGRTSEYIGRQVGINLLEDLDSGAAVDRHLADQIIPYAALAEGTSLIAVPQMTEHLEARLWLIEEILGAKTILDGPIIAVKGIGYRRGS